MKKGIVVEEKRAYYIVMTEECHYIRLSKDKKAQVGQEIYFFPHDTIQKNNNPQKIGITLVASILLLVTLVSFWTVQPMMSHAVGVVSIDINPSMEFYIDKSLKVQEFKAFNREAEDILDDSMIGMEIDVALKEVIDLSIKMNYLSTENNDVLVAGGAYKSGSDLEIEDNLRKTMEEYRDIDFTYIQVSAEFVNTNQREEKSVGLKGIEEMDENPDSPSITAYEKIKVKNDNALKREEKPSNNAIDGKEKTTDSKKTEMQEKEKINKGNDKSNKDMTTNKEKSIKNEVVNGQSKNKKNNESGNENKEKKGNNNEDNKSGKLKPNKKDKKSK